MEPDLLDLGDMKTEFRKIRRTNIYKFMVRKGTFKSQAELDRFFDANEIRSAFLTDTNPKDSVAEFNSTIPTHLFMQNKLAEDELRANVRFSRNRGGEFATGRRTATEAENVNQANEVTDSERRDIIGDAVERLGNGLNYLLFNVWSAADVFKFLGKKVSYWPVSADDTQLAGINLEVNGEDMAPPSTFTEQASAQRFYELTAGNPLFNPFASAIDLVLAHNKHPNEVIDPVLGTLNQLLAGENGGLIKQQLEAGIRVTDANPLG